MLDVQYVMMSDEGIGGENERGECGHGLPMSVGETNVCGTQGRSDTGTVRHGDGPTQSVRQKCTRSLAIGRGDGAPSTNASSLQQRAGGRCHHPWAPVVACLKPGVKLGEEVDERGCA